MVCVLAFANQLNQLRAIQPHDRFQHRFSSSHASPWPLSADAASAATLDSSASDHAPIAAAPMQTVLRLFNEREALASVDADAADAAFRVTVSPAYLMKYVPTRSAHIEVILIIHPPENGCP
jgi:hypothetical protein